MNQADQTLFISCEQGFASRYLLRTDIFKTLKKSEAKIVILTPNADEGYFRHEFIDDNVSVEPIFTHAYQKYRQKGLQPFLEEVKLYVLNGKMDLHSIDTRYEIYKKKRPSSSIKNKFRNIILDLMVFWLRRSRFLRKSLIRFEHIFYTPSFHSELFQKYQPQKLIISSLGYFGYDRYLMREAKKHKVKIISVILSWDNTSSKHLPGGDADHVIAWTEKMKEELIGYLDVDQEKVYVGGIAHFDFYFKKKHFWDETEFYSKLGLDPERKVLFFAPKSPNNYPWNPDIVELLAQAIENDSFIKPCQLLVRLHPLNFRTRNGEFRFREDTERHLALRKKYKNLIYDLPEILSKKLTMDMPNSELKKVAGILNNADIMLSFFSTLMLEACIFDLPIINIAIYPHHQDLTDIHAAEKRPHIKRIVETQGVQTAYNKAELINLINLYLENRGQDSQGRKLIVRQECGPNFGNAGESIGTRILDLEIRNKQHDSS